MAWIQITEADLLTGISGPELEAVRVAALGENQVDPVQPAIDQVTREVRGRVAVKNPVGDGNTIPDELLAHAVAIIVMRLPLRAAGLVIDPEDERSKAAARAESVLKDVALGSFKIEAPATVSDEEIGAPGPSIKPRDRNRTRDKYDGT